MTERPEFDIYREVDREIAQAAERQVDEMLDGQDDLAQAVHEELGAAKDKDDIDLEADIDPTQAETLDALKNILGTRRNIRVIKYEQIYEDSKNKIEKDSEDAKARIPAEDASTLADAEADAEIGSFIDAKAMINDNASTPDVRDEMHRVIDWYVLEQAEADAEIGSFIDAKAMINDNASSPAVRDEMEQAIDKYVLSSAEADAEIGSFIDANATIDESASSPDVIYLMKRALGLS